MTAKEMIKALQALPQDLDIVLYVSDLTRKGDTSVYNFRAPVEITFQPCEHDDYILIRAATEHLS